MFGLNDLLGIAGGIGTSGVMEDGFGEQLSQLAMGLTPINDQARKMALGPIGQLLGLAPGGGIGGGLPGAQSDPRLAGPGGIAGGLKEPQMAPNMDAGEDVTVTGDGWKPRKQTILGALADGYLMSKGKQPMFSLMRDRRSFNEAMQGYQQDPKQSINRVLKIPGMEDEALKMLNQQTDNDRAATVAQLQKAKFEEGIRDRVAALMGAAKPDTWGSVAPIAKRVLERYGMDTSEIPENYDEAAIQAFRYGAVPVDKQMDNARADEALDERVRLAEEAEEGRNSRTVYSQEQQTNRTILGQDRQDARNVYNNNRADQRKLITPPKGMAAAGQGRGITGSGKFLEKDGQRVGELTPDGKYMMLYSGDKVRLYDAKTRKFSHEAEIPNK